MVTIAEYITSMFKYFIIAIPIFSLIRFVLGKFKKRIINWWHEAGIVLLLSFLSGLFALTFDQDASDQQTAVNIVPFKVINDTVHAISNSGFWEPFAINFLGNMIIFIPIGVMVPLLWRKFGIRYTILSGFLISFFIEAVQLSLDRSSDVDDLWLNTLGVLVGYGLYKLLPENFKNRFKTNDKSFASNQAG